MKIELTNEEMETVLYRANYVTGMQYDGRIPNGALERNIDRYKELAIKNKIEGKPISEGWI